MTPSEIEAELRDMRAQLAQLQEQQDIRTKAWSSLASQYRIIAAGLLAGAVVLIVLQIWHRDSSAMSVAALLVLQSLPLGIFRHGLRGGAVKA